MAPLFNEVNRATAVPKENAMPRAIASTMSMLGERPLFLVIDGHAMVHRAWNAIKQPLNVRSTGEEVRAVYGFANTFLRVISDWNPTHCAITFDLPTPTFRHHLYKEYKAQRPEAPPELKAQFGRVRQLMEAFAVPIFEVDGFEADDVIGTLCRHAEEKEIEALILTGDTDTFQLVSPWVRVLLHYRIQEKKVFDEAAVRERYGGLMPEVQPDLKALQGDPSDNIPGVPGVGSKTAIKLLNDFGSLENLYANIEKVTPPKLRETMTTNKERAIQGKVLTSIVKDVPLELDMEACRFWRYDRSKVIDVCRELEFLSMVSRIPETSAPSASQEKPLVERAEVPTDYRTVRTREALKEMAAELSSSSGFAFDLETTGQDTMRVDMVGLSFSNAPGRGWYVPVGHQEDNQVPLEDALSILGPLLEDPQIPKVAHNGNYDMTVLANYGIQVQNLDFDTMVAAHLAGHKSVGLKAMALECFGEEMAPITDLIGTGRKQITMAEVAVDKASGYACADADFTGRLKSVLEAELKEKDLLKLLHEIEMPLVPILVKMQRNGVALDTGLLQEMSRELGQDIGELEREIYDTVGHQFNINSSQQLGDVLFKELRLPPTKRTKTGYSTDAAVLESLRQVEDIDPKPYEVLGLILKYRELGKLKSTYVDSLPELVNPRTRRLHTSYNQTGSATGRVSSNDPNIQNIPVRTELGNRVRKAFITQDPQQWVLLGADYSQIELRILAHISQDPGLLEAFYQGEDIHAATASMVYGVPTDRVTLDMRRIAKVMNFGVIYGLSAYGISQQTDLSREEGASFIQTYFSKYPGIQEYTDATKKQARDLGYVETLLKRRRYLPEITSGNFPVRQAAERMAVNMPIQGTAADIIKIAMVRIQERMDQLKLRSMMIIQVHDELIFEVPNDELDQMRAIILEVMPLAMSLSVPLKVELKTGHRWGEME